jgi:hypothetical protein
MDFVDRLWDIGEGMVPTHLVERLTIHGLWDTRLWFAPSSSEIGFRCRFIVAQTHHQGCAFYPGNLDASELETLVGQHYRVARDASLPLKVAVADTLFAFARPRLPACRWESEVGTPTEKASWRARVVGDEAKRILGSARTRSSRPRVVLVGVSALILDELLRMDCTVAAVDLDPHVVGWTARPGVLVGHGADVEATLAESDMAVVTGMTLTTRSLGSILAQCVASHTRVLVYAQTGANIAPWYMLYGADTVVCERIPFYNFEGLSEIHVYRRESTIFPEDRQR